MFSEIEVSGDGSGEEDEEDAQEDVQEDDEDDDDDDNEGWNERISAYKNLIHTESSYTSLAPL